VNTTKYKIQIFISVIFTIVLYTFQKKKKKAAVNIEMVEMDELEDEDEDEVNFGDIFIGWNDSDEPFLPPNVSVSTIDSSNDGNNIIIECTADVHRDSSQVIENDDTKKNDEDRPRRSKRNLSNHPFGLDRKGE
jgi:hypothetical protein